MTGKESDAPKDDQAETVNPQDRTQDASETRDDTALPSSEPSFPAKSPETPRTEHKTYRARQECRDKFKLGFEIATFFAIVGYATLAALQWYATLAANTLTKQSADAAKESAKVANQTLIASQRAWIRIDQIGLGGGGLAIDKNGASVSVSFKITNVGNSPAINVTPYAWLVVLKSGGPPLGQEQQKRCGEVRSQAFGPGFTLFPNEPFPSNIGIGEWSLGTNASREDIEKGATVSADKAHMLLYVIGCIDYTFPTDAATHHQTGFSFEVREDRAFPIALKDGIIPVSRLYLMDTGIGTGKYAD
jgi:hypothetical protein